MNAYLDFIGYIRFLRSFPLLPSSYLLALHKEMVEIIAQLLLLPRLFSLQGNHNLHHASLYCNRREDVENVKTFNIIRFNHHDWDILSLEESVRATLDGIPFVSNPHYCCLDRMLVLRGGGTDYSKICDNDNELTGNSSAGQHTATRHYLQQSEEMASQQHSTTHLSLFSPKRIWAAAKTVFDQTKYGILRFNSNHRLSSKNNERVGQAISNDVEFAELDSILEQSDTADRLPSSVKKEYTQTNTVEEDSNEWLSSTPRGASLLKEWNQRSLRAWIHKVSDASFTCVH
jgi:hypothetical protein